jgi:hypothetical protein
MTLLVDVWVFGVEDGAVEAFELVRRSRRQNDRCISGHHW